MNPLLSIKPLCRHVPNSPEFKSQIEVLQKDYQEALQGQASGEYNQVMEIFSHLRSVAQNCQIDGQAGEAGSLFCQGTGCCFG